MKKKYYHHDKNKLNLLKEDFSKFANDEKLDYQETEDSDGQWICQFKKKKGITSRAVTVLMTPYGDNTIQVSVGQAKWATKATGGLIALAIAGPLALVIGITTVVSTIGQVKLINEVTKLINLRLSEKH